MDFFTPLLLAIALSIDGFGVGLTYGIRNVRLDIFPIILISACAGGAMTISIFAGQIASRFLSDQLSGTIGGTILIIIGLWQLLEGWKNYKIKKLKEKGENHPVLLSININIFGLVFQVLRQPEKGDIDSSGNIDYLEALFLGIALNMDVVGAGLGAGIAGYSLLLIPTIALSLFLALLSGIHVGRRYSNKNFLNEKGSLLPGTLLIILGVINVFIF